MSFSLADCILNSRDPDKKSRLEALLPLSAPERSSAGEAKEKPQASAPAKASAPVKAGAQAKPSAQAKPGAPAKPSAPAKQGKGARGKAKKEAAEAPIRAEKPPREEILRLKSLFGEVSSEWPKLVKAVRELREALLEEARVGARDGQGAVPSSPALDGEKKVKATVPSNRGGASRGEAGQGGADGSNAVPSTAQPSEPKAGPPPPNGMAAKESSEIHSKLAELLRLLKQSLEAKGNSAARMVEIPKNLTLEIAREVAGRVKESLASPLHASDQNDPHGKPRLTPEGATAPKKIPLDDVAAIIDQITGMRQ